MYEDRLVDIFLMKLTACLAVCRVCLWALFECMTRPLQKRLLNVWYRHQLCVSKQIDSFALEVMDVVVLFLLYNTHKTILHTLFCSSLHSYKTDTTEKIRELGDVPLHEIIRDIGGWPATDASWVSPSMGIEILLGRLRGNFNQGILLEQWVGPDDRNSSANIIQVRKRDF